MMLRYSIHCHILKGKTGILHIWDAGNIKYFAFSLEKWLKILVAYENTSTNIAGDDSTVRLF